MKTKQVMACALACAAGPAAFAQSSVSIYGILDTGVEHASASNGVSNTIVMQTAHVPSRLGFRGTEDLGGGMHAGFLLEMGIGVDTGSILQGGRGFGRESYVSFGSASAGTLRLGRQYSVMQSVAFYDPDHFSTYSPALAMQLSNLEQTSQDNVIRYVSPEFGGFSGTLSYAMGEKAAAAPNPGAPQVVGAGTAKSSRGLLLSYGTKGLAEEKPGLLASLAYQDGGQDLTAGGVAKQRMIAASALYDFGAWELGGVWWQHRGELPNRSTPQTTLWTVGASWRVLPALRLIAQVGRAQDNGLAYTTGAAKARGRDTYMNFGATYSFSRSVHVYFRVGRVADENNGFNGRASLASTSLREAAPVPVNGSSRGAMAGLRIRF